MRYFGIYIVYFIITRNRAIHLQKMGKTTRATTALKMLIPPEIPEDSLQTLFPNLRHQRIVYITSEKPGPSPAGTREWYHDM